MEMFILEFQSEMRKSQPNPRERKKSRYKAVISPVSMLSKEFTLDFQQIFQQEQDEVFMNLDVKMKYVPLSVLWK